MAARLTATGEIKKIKAFLLADLVGSKQLHFMRDPTTKSLTDLVWNTAAKLGYSEIFINPSKACKTTTTPSPNETSR